MYCVWSNIRTSKTLKDKNMIGKTHLSGSKMLFACCDKELINKEIKHNNTKIVISEKFYGTQEITKEEFLKNINCCSSANIFGKKACDLLLKNKVVLKEQIIYINNIPHTQIYKI